MDNIRTILKDKNPKLKGLLISAELPPSHSENNQTFWVLGYESYFGKNVEVAVVNLTTKTMNPTHGYFIPHEIGIKNKKWCNNNDFTFIND